MLAAFLLQAAIAGFAPPIDTPLLVQTERVEHGLDDRRFTFDRMVRFAREDGGYRAEVRVLAVDSDTGQPVGGMIEAGFAALSGKTIVVHLDSQGRATRVDDAAALWSALADGIGDIVASRRLLPTAQRAALAQRIAMPLRAFPAERQVTALASLASAIIPDEPPEPVGTLRAIELPGASPFGRPLMLTGTKQTRAEEGALETLTRAAADISLPAEGKVSARSGHVAFERRLRTDPKTGLVLSNTETTRTMAGERPTLRVTTISVKPAPSSAWPKP